MDSFVIRSLRNFCKLLRLSQMLSGDDSGIELDGFIHNGWAEH